MVEGVYGPDPNIVAVAERYAKSRGIELRRQREYVDVDESFARKLALAYEKMEHAPSNPRVKLAYRDLVRQTKAQYQALADAGYRFWFVDPGKDAAYLESPWNAIRELRSNKSMGVYPTEHGFGSSDKFSPDENPLLEETDIQWPVGGLDGPLKKVLVNDLFRAVHDAFGHGLEGAGFRARGEENAWQAHVRLFTGPAVWALTSETRGQNSWVNYGPYGEFNRTAKPGETVYADQKTGLLPDWAWKERIAPDAESVRFSRVPTRASVEKNLTKLPEPLRGPVRTATMAIRDISERVLDRTVFLHTLIDRAVKSGLKSAKQYAELHGRMEAETRALEREVERVADLYAYVEDKDRGNHARSANEFIYTTTKTGKWWRGENADPELRAWFDELGPNAQKFVEAVFAHGQKVLSVKKAAVLEWATSEYDPLIENTKRKLQEAATPEQKAELQRGLEELLADKQQALKDFQSLFAIREGKPYAPIKRFGPWAVVAKSEEYIDAEARNDLDRIRELEQDEAHYYVDFVDTKGEARRLADKLAASGAYATDGGVTFFEREQNEADLYGSRDMLGALARLRSRINDSADNPVRTQMRKLVADMWLVELAERSARKSEMRRRGISGDIDMLRSFAAQGRADARFIASVKYNPQIEDVVQRMRQEVRYGGDRARKSEIFNEIMRRRVAAMDVTHNPSVDKLLRLTSIYFLATSPAYYLQNLTQPFMMSVPYMAARHEYAKIANELVRAYKEITPVVKSGKLLETGLDYGLVPKDVKEAIQELVNRGRIDIGLETELGEFQIDGGSKFSKTWNKIDKGLRLLVQKGEAINRLSTAIAAYRLEMARTGNAEAAIDYADTVLRDTHGYYGRFNAPTAFNSQFGRVALQFRKFQLIQLTYYMSLLKTVFTDPKERWAAARVLAFSLGHTAALGGVVGLPGYAAVALVAQGLANLFGDDDEPYDLTYNLRELIGDETLANLILRGAPTLAGVDLSGKVGAGQMLSIQPFSDADLSTSRGRAEYLGTLVGGASFGLVNRLADGFGLMMDGDWLRGLERVLPKGLSDAVKAYREADQGITKRSGEMLIAPEEVSLWDSMVKALGLPPVTNNVLYERQDRLRAVEDRLAERSREIKRAYITARKNGDTAKAREAVDQWSKLQATRVRLGFKKQPWSELYRAKREADRREQQKVNGIGYNSGNRAYVERMASM